MTNGSHDSKFLAGVLLGVGLGCATLLLLDPKLRASVAAGARDLADRLRRGHGGGERRADRAFLRRVERIRTAGL